MFIWKIFFVNGILLTRCKALFVIQCKSLIIPKSKTIHKKLRTVKSCRSIWYTFPSIWMLDLSGSSNIIIPKMTVHINHNSSIRPNEITSIRANNDEKRIDNHIDTFDMCYFQSAAKTQCGFLCANWRNSLCNYMTTFTWFFIKIEKLIRTTSG